MNLTSVPQDPIGECHNWRDFLTNVAVFGGSRNASANLSAALNAGVNGIVAAQSNANYQIVVSSTSVLFSDTRLVYNGTSAAVAASHIAAPAVLINAAGIAMGINRASDGLWVSTVFIDAITGNAAFLGNLIAGSIIDASVTVSGTGNSMGLIDSNASIGLTNANLALSTKLNRSAADVLSGAINITTAGGFKAGTITWDGSGNLVSGSGVAITAKGLVGASSGVVTFSIDATTGNATFAGALSGATGTFAGNVTSGGNVDVSGYVHATGAFSVGGYANSISGVTSVAGNNGVYGGATTGSGVIGITSGGGTGVTGGAISSGVGVAATAVGGSAIALSVTGPMIIDNSTLVTNLNAQYWGGFKFIATTTGTGTATLTSNKPGSNQTFSWLPITNTSGTVLGYLPWVAP